MYGAEPLQYQRTIRGIYDPSNGRTLIGVEMYLLLHFLKQELCNPQSSTAVKPGICQIVRYQLFHFYRTQTLHGKFCEPFLLRNLAFKRSFSRYGRKMALALASSSTQFSAVCSSGNCKKVQTWFFKVRNYSETSDCLFLHEKKHVKMFLPF